MEKGKWCCWRRKHTNGNLELSQCQGHDQNKEFRLERRIREEKGGPSLVPTGAHGDHYEQLPLDIWRKLNLREVKSVLSNCDI